MRAANVVWVPPAAERDMRLMGKVIVLLLLVALVTTGCAGLTAREQGALVGGAGGAAGGALLGAAAGNAALGAAIGGPVGLLGGYLIGDHFFRDDPRRKTSTNRVGGYSSKRNSLPTSKTRAYGASGKSPQQYAGEEDGGRVF